MKKIGSTKFKKALSVLCAVSLLAVSISVVFSVTAAASEVTTVNYDFEDEKTRTTGTLTVGGETVRLTSYDTPTDDSANHNVWSVFDDNGNKVLRIKDTGNNVQNTGYQPGVFILNDGTTPCTLTLGTNYTVTLRYKVLNVDTTNQAWLYFTQSPSTGTGVWGNLASSYNALDGSEHKYAKNRILSAFNKDNFTNDNMADLNGTKVKLGKWNTFSYTFTAQDKGNGNYFGLATCTIPSLEMYIDDITLVSGGSAIAFDSNGGEPVDTIYGKVGDQIELPTPIKAGYEFDGWYTDRTLQNKFEEETYTEPKTGAGKVLYAKWISHEGRTVYDFEKGAWSEENTDGFRLGGTFMEGKDTTLYYAINVWDINTDMCAISPESNITNNNVLRVYKTNTKSNPLITLNDGNRPYRLEKDKQYNISFKYKVVSSAESLSFITVAAGLYPYPNNNAKMTAKISVFDDGPEYGNKNDYKIISFKTDEVKQWNGTGTVDPTTTVSADEWHTFTATFNGIDEGNIGGNYVYPYLAIYTEIQPGAEIHFDDFVIDTKSTVTFNANGGTINDQTPLNQTGDIGTPLTFPKDPVKVGYTFTGWYTNQGCTTQYTEAVFPGVDTTLYAGWGLATDLVKYCDFEDGKTKTSGTLTVGDRTVRLTSYDTPTDSSTNHNVWSVYNDSGNNVLRIKDTGKNTTDGKQYQPAVFLLNDGEKPYSLTPGKTYTITMRYKLMNVGDINNGWLYVTQSPTEGSKGVWGELIAEYNALDGSKHSEAKNRILSSFNSGSLSTLKDLNGNSVTKGEWNTFSYTFTAQDKGKGNYIGFATCTIPKFEIYIDDVELVEQDYKAIKFNSNGGSDEAMIAGKGTTEIVLPIPTKDGFTFRGWYTDKALTQKFDGNTYGKLSDTITTLYAKWVAKDKVYNFEDGSFKTDGTFKEGGDTLYYAINNWAPDKAMCEIINANGADGTDSKVLKVYNNRDDGARNYPVITLNDGDRPYKLEKDKQYTVSFKYKVVNGGNTSTSWMTVTKGVAVHKDVKMNAPVSAFDDNATPIDKENFKVISFTSNSVKQWTGTGAVSPTQSVSMNQWHTFTATFKGGEWSGVHPYLAIYLDVQPGAEIYFDDFVIRAESTVTFNTNGGTALEPITREIGDKVTLPKSEKEGYAFLGWFGDAEMTESVGKSITVSKPITLYAKWVEETTVKFEDYPNDWTARIDLPNLNPVFSRLASINTSFKPNDKVLELSVKENLQPKDYTYFKLNIGESGFKAYSGVKYIISFDYYAKNVSSELKIRPVTAGDSNIWSGIKDYTDSAFNVSPSDVGKGWLKGSLLFTSEPNLVNGKACDTLYILTSNYANPTKLYIDNIKIKAVTDYTCVAAIEPNNGRDTVYLLGNVGEKIVMPQVKYGNNLFEGWSLNSYSTDSNSSYTFTEGVTNISAIWTPRGLVADANSDASLDVRDLLIVKASFKDGTGFSQAPTHDINGDNIISKDDFTQLRNVLLGTESGDIKGRMLIAGNEITECNIVLPSAVSRIVKTAAESLAQKLNDYYGISVNITDETAAKSEYEILVGDVNRTECSQISESGKYTICVKNKKLVINAAEGDDAPLAGALMALEGFCERAYNKSITFGLDADYAINNSFNAGHSGYKYVWGDEFNGTGLNSKLWVDQSPQYITLSCLQYNELKSEAANAGLSVEKYAENKGIAGKCYAKKSEGVYVEGGNAVIYADYNPDTGIFTHRQISTKGTHEYLYGCMEIRAKLSLYPGADAIWFASVNKSSITGAGQEIDLLEQMQYPQHQFAANLHFWGGNHASLDDTSDKKDKVYALKDTSKKLSDDYHIYTLEWTPNTMKFCVDGEAFFNYDIHNGALSTAENGYTTGPETFQTAVYSLLSTTMGASTYSPTWKSGDPERVELLVDYVRLYQRTSDGGYSKETYK